MNLPTSANFLAALRVRGHTVARVSAGEAKDKREKLLASIDNLDLLGIAMTLLTRLLSGMEIYPTSFGARPAS